jgi:hypothetical protein
MTDKPNITLPNSFTLRFTNTTNFVQPITLFREGTNNPNDVSGLQTATTNGNDAFPILDAPTWSVVSNQPYVYFNNPLLTSLPTYPTISDITIRGTGNILLVSDNETSPSVFSTITIPVTNGETLGVVNTRINQYIRNFGDLTNFKNVDGDFMTLNLVVDFTIFDAYPLPINLALDIKPYGISIQYPYPTDLPIGSTGFPIRLSKIFFPSTASVLFDKCYAIPLEVSAGANGVLVTGVQNIPYEAIKQSQNGGVLAIQSLTLNVGSTPSKFESESQLLQPFLFKKIDANGNEIETQKAQTIDPYQDQYSFAVVDMLDDGENYILDGNTRFSYNVEGQTTMNLTFNYIQLTIANFNRAEGVILYADAMNKLDEFNNQNAYVRTLVIDSEQNKPNTLIGNKSVSAKKVGNKPNYVLPLLIGGVALYYILKNK